MDKLLLKREYKLEKRNDDNFLIIDDERILLINKFFDFILSRVTKDTEESELLKELTEKFNLEMYDSKYVLDEYKIFIEKCNKESKSKKSYIKFQIQLLNKNKVKKISKPFLFLFKENVIFPILLITIITHVIFITVTEINYSFQTFNTFEIFFIYILFFILLFFHEIGHSTATFFYKTEPKEIGFGFYFIFPVFYTDVTKIWMLEKKQRLIVNIGGVYFQLIINSFLMLLYIYTKNLFIINSLSFIILTNIYIIIYSLFPFFRNDGYWIYSDLFDIKNLLYKSNYLILDIIKERKKVRKIDDFVTILIFSVANWIFRFYVIFILIKGIINSFLSFHGIMNNSLTDILGLLFKIILMIIGLYLMLHFIFSLFIKKSTSSDEY